ncbi:MAG: glycosyltransferase 87 family protein [Gaiellaceae bacterium]
MGAGGLIQRAPARVRVAQLRPFVGMAGLAGVLAFGLVIALRASAAPSHIVPSSRVGFPGWLAGPLPGTGPTMHWDEFAWLLIGLSVSYLVVLACAEALSPRLVLAVCLTAVALFTLAPPILSGDIFGYVDWARMAVLHGFDPYTHGSAAAPHDPVFRYMMWHDNLPSPYGPLFTLFSYLTVPLGVPAAMWFFKAVTGLAACGCLVLTAAIARRLERSPAPAVAFVGLNPLFLTYAVGGGHNDLLMLVVVLAGVYLAVSGRAAAGAGALVPAAAIKLSGGFALPFMLLGSRDRRGALKGVVVALAAVGVVVLIGFGSHPLGFLSTVHQQQDMVALFSVPSRVGHWLGFGGLTAGIRAAAIVLLLGTVLAMLWRTWRGYDWIAATGWSTLALLVASAWILPWYTVWLLPFAALSRERLLKLGAIGLGAFVIGVRLNIWL